MSKAREHITRHNFDPGYAATAPGGFRLHNGPIGLVKSVRVAENTPAAQTIKTGDVFKLASV